MALGEHDPGERSTHERGPYEVDEERVPLLSHRSTDKWTQMEAEVFNAVTRYWDRPVAAGTTPKASGKPLFSKRLAAVDAMLKAFDQFVREHR